MKKIFPNPALLFALAVAIMFFRCSPNEPNGAEGKSLYLQAEDASCTEAWFTLRANKIPLPVEINLMRNDSLAQTITLATEDTLIYDEGLLPNAAYSYQAFANGNEIRSPEVTITTMDTTSHDFTWQTFTFGGANGSSALYDVAIINENDIWAVGEIHTEWTDQYDSSGVWVQPYNAVHWNGQEWELIRIGGYGYWAYSTVYAFNENDVWFDGTVQWDGQTYTAHVNNFPLEPNGDGWRVYGMWGTSSSDFYIVGQHGNIAHYNGSRWEKIESGGYSDNLFDVYGKDENNVYTVGGNISAIAGAIFKKNGNKFELLKEGRSTDGSNLFQPYFMGSLTAVFISDNQTVYFGGHYLYRKKYSKWELINSLKGNYYGGNGLAQHWGFISAIRGKSDNEIIFTGERGTIRYYNGIRWSQLGENYNPNSEYDWVAVDMEDDLIVTVGDKLDYYAAIMILRRR